MSESPTNPLPTAAVAKLAAAASVGRQGSIERRLAIDEAIAWCKRTYPQFFIQE